MVDEDEMRKLAAKRVRDIQRERDAATRAKAAAAKAAKAKAEKERARTKKEKERAAKQLAKKREKEAVEKRRKAEKEKAKKAADKKREKERAAKADAKAKEAAARKAERERASKEKKKNKKKGAAVICPHVADPRTAWTYFGMDDEPKLGETFGETQKRRHREWKSLPPDKKKFYEMMAEADKTRHDNEIAKLTDAEKEQRRRTSIRARAKNRAKTTEFYEKIGIPPAPKRAQNAFFTYAATVRDEMKRIPEEERPPLVEQSRIASERWKDPSIVSEEEKKRYEDDFREALEKYRVDRREWEIRRDAAVKAYRERERSEKEAAGGGDDAGDLDDVVMSGSDDEHDDGGGDDDDASAGSSSSKKTPKKSADKPAKKTRTKTSGTTSKKRVRDDETSDDAGKTNGTGAGRSSKRRKAATK